MRKSTRADRAWQTRGAEPSDVAQKSWQPEVSGLYLRVLRIWKKNAQGSGRGALGRKAERYQFRQTLNRSCVLSLAALNFTLAAIRYCTPTPARLGS